MQIAARETAEAALREPIRLDPEMEAAIARSNAESARYPDTMTVPAAEARRISIESRVWLNRGGPRMARTEDVRIPDMLGARELPVRIYYPSDKRPLPVLVFLHGGGWMLCSIATHDRLARTLAERSGCAVASVEYALAPERKFPAGLRQAAAACRWARAEGAKHGFDTARIAAGGDSAGANLALAAALQLRDTSHSDLLKFLLLFYGVYDSDFATASYRRYADGPYLLTATRMQWLWREYVVKPAEMRDPFAAPLHAELVRLPPCHLSVAEIDVLHDENARMAQALEAASVKTDIRVYPGLTHAFAQFASLVPAADRAVSEAAAALRAALA